MCSKIDIAVLNWVLERNIVKTSNKLYNKYLQPAHAYCDRQRRVLFIMTVARDSRTRPDIKAFGDLSEAEIRIFVSDIDPKEVSYDFALKLRDKPYSLEEFLDDLGQGFIKRSNVAMRRHYVMRHMSAIQGRDVTQKDFELALFERIAHGGVSQSALSNLDDVVIDELRLKLVLQH